jgi:hypothetical protein
MRQIACDPQVREASLQSIGKRAALGIPASMPNGADILVWMQTRTSNVPVAGKTYSLFGGGLSTEPYYERIRMLADEILRLVPGEEALLSLIRKAGGRKRRLARAARQGNGTPISDVLRLLGPALSPYTGNVRRHLKSLPLLSVTDRILRTTEEQYHLHMLEIELVNRRNRKRFLACDRRIALLPHCLRDFRVECRSVPGDIRKTLDELEAEHIRIVLEHAGGNRTAAASILGISRVGLLAKMRKYGIVVGSSGRGGGRRPARDDSAGEEPPRG